jgi:hypothetical protein
MCENKVRGMEKKPGPKSLCVHGDGVTVAGTSV